MSGGSALNRMTSGGSAMSLASFATNFAARKLIGLPSTASRIFMGCSDMTQRNLAPAPPRSVDLHQIHAESQRRVRRRRRQDGCPLLHPTEDTARSGLGEATRLREGSAGAAHGWAAIRFPWPWMVFGMRIALPSTGELPPTRRPGGSPKPLRSY